MLISEKCPQLLAFSIIDKKNDYCIASLFITIFSSNWVIARAWVSPKYTRNRKWCIFIYLCVMLHINDSMCMLRHHVVDCLPWLIKVVINAVEGRITELRQCSARVVQCSCGSSSRMIMIQWKSALWSMLFQINLELEPYGSSNHSRLAWYSVARY